MRVFWLIVAFVLVGSGGAIARTPKPTPTPVIERVSRSADLVIEKRVERLEKEVRLLKETIADLNAQITTTRSLMEAQEKARNPKYPLYRVDEDQQAIRQALREGMSQDDVRKLIGEPDRIDRYAVTGTTWYYGFRHVDFGYNGLVIGWFGF